MRGKMSKYEYWSVPSSMTRNRAKAKAKLMAPIKNVPYTPIFKALRMFSLCRTGNYRMKTAQDSG